MEQQVQTLISDIQNKLASYLKEDKKIFATSSFQTHSLPMLHILSSIDKSIPIYFINTGFHFTETLKFRETISSIMGLNLIDLTSLIPKNLQLNDSGHFYFNSDPDYCCYINKIQPIENILNQYDIWISGIRSDQNNNRSNLQEEEKTPNGKLRYHPMLKWSSKLIYYYIKKYNLPKHPLEDKGYFSIGCQPCTRMAKTEVERGGRWQGLEKTECGLHTDLIGKNTQ